MGKIKVVAGYALQQKLGSGSFAVVYRGVRVEARHLPQQLSQEHPPQQHPGDAGSSAASVVAIKSISRTSEKLTKKVLQNLEIEISILRSYRHRNIVCMHDFHKTDRNFYLILEYCGGGDVQKLIRTRRSLRLTEGLARRLMRDLASGLRFLWGQELIHRDIKPQNLLLTGPLPLDEANDPAKTDEMERRRCEANFPSDQFVLKIADFGFARHLQSASLAETLCGSPLYMAPEILQHHRYDAKADLWSVGTVLFEMITGQPPFTGENQFDLLRNIQRKAVRLPPDVRVSSECVALLRLLLNRNPLSRAGFKEFFDACDAFAALGCNGVATHLDAGVCFQPASGGLGSIPEDSSGAEPAHEGTAATSVLGPLPIVSPPLVPSMAPGTAPPDISSAGIVARTSRTVPVLAPLVPSPPSSAPSPIYSLSALRGGGDASLQRAAMWPTTQPQAADVAPILRDNLSEENSFVMVEHSSLHRSTSGGALAYPPSSVETSRLPAARLNPSPPSSPSPGYYLPRNPMVSSRGEYMIVRQPPKGMLSTSPGTGGALMGLLSGRARLVQDPAQQAASARHPELDARIAGWTKMLAVSEDVGRRAISVAHLGDQRAYAAMRLLAANECASSSSLASMSRMEGIEEEADGIVTDDSACMDATSTVRRRRSSSATDKSMPDNKPDDEIEELPFVLTNESSSPGFPATTPARDSTSSQKGTTIAGSRTLIKSTPAMIRAHFREALSCYLKSLKMLKSAIAASQNVSKEVGSIVPSSSSGGSQQALVHKIRSRCEVTTTWLGGQFRGVLERGDATSAEISKLSASAVSDQEDTTVPCLEELMFSHVVGYGREGAVKQLLGQLESARSCYRTAGLLAETLLMESSLVADDRKLLEEYVDGFAARIHELDTFVLQQSRSATSSSIVPLSVKPVSTAASSAGQTFPRPAVAVSIFEPHSASPSQS